MRRLLDCVRLVRDSEFSDDEAVAMIRDAAGGRQGVLHTFAGHFSTRDWQGDPLLEHVSALVQAAVSGQVPAPLDDATAATVQEERRLLRAQPAEGFEMLAARQPALRQLAGKAMDPAWRDEQDRNPILGPLDPPPPGVQIESGIYASDPPPRVGLWLARRMAKRMERAAAKQSADPRMQEFRQAVAEMRSHEGTMSALRQELVLIVGPYAAADDALLRTQVARDTAWTHLREIAGIRPPPLPPDR